MKFLTGLLVLFLLSCGIYGQSQAVKIPKGNNILIDGKIYPEEWDDARKIQISDSVNLYFKSDKNYIYIATQKTGDGGCVADLYYVDDGKMVNLHASAKLGQRNFVAGKWEEWTWWNNSLWAANVSRFDSFQTRTFLTESAREFQIDKKMFSEKRTKLFFEITAFKSGGENTVIKYPADGNRDKTDQWLNVSWK